MGAERVPQAASRLIPFAEPSQKPHPTLFISLATPGCKGAWEMQFFIYVPCLLE